MDWRVEECWGRKEFKTGARQGKRSVSCDKLRWGCGVTIGAAMKQERPHLRPKRVLFLNRMHCLPSKYSSLASRNSIIA
jgi:hypothetical protein